MVRVHRNGLSETFAQRVVHVRTDRAARENQEFFVRYTPGAHCLELKSLKMYWLAYRNLGIFQENIVNKFLRDVVKYADPIRATVIGDFTPRGGIATVIRASYERGKKRGR